MSISSSTAPAPIRRADGWIAALVGLIAFLCYARTLAAGLLPNDSAEFQTLAYLQASAHTTGYMIYLLLAKVFTFLPVGDVAYRVNLFSAFLGGVTTALLYLSALLVSGSRRGAALAAAALAAGATFWSQAIIAEVYTAASAFVAGVLFCLLLWSRARQRRYLWAAAFLGGLGFGVHGMVVLFGLAALVYVLLHRPNLKRIALPVAAGALLGIAVVYGAHLLQDGNQSSYNIFQSAYGPAISAWDAAPQEIDTPWERFWFLATARQWRSAMFVDPLTVMPDNLMAWLEALIRDFSPLTILLSAYGLALLARKNRKDFALIVVAALVHLVYTFNYRIGDIYVFFIVAHLYLLVPAACGAAGLLAWAEKRLPWLGRPTAQGAALAALLLLAWLPFGPARVGQLLRGEARFSFAGVPPESELAPWRANLRQTVAKMEPNAIVFASWYDLYAYTYVAYVELGRTDLAFLEPTPYSIKGGMAESMGEFIRANRGVRPILFQYRIQEITSVAHVSVETVMVGPTRFERVRD